MRLLKTVLLLLCVSFSSVYVQASDRSEGITISCKNESLEQVIHLIESQSSYLFVLNDKVNTKHKVSIKIENGNINAILNKIFQGTNMTYQVDGDHILISTTHKSIGLDETRQTTMIKGKIVDNAGEPIDYAMRSGAPMEVIENLQEIEDEGDTYESIEDIWPDYPSKEDFLFNEDEY